MQALNESQVVIQNTRTGKQVIVTKHFFEAQIKAHKTSKFHEFEIVPTATKPVEVIPTQEQIDALNEKMGAEGFKKNTLTANDKAILAYLKSVKEAE